MPAPEYIERWRALLAHPLAEIVAALTRDDQEMMDLRQCSPFAGVVTEEEWQMVIRAIPRG